MSGQENILARGAAPTGAATPAGMSRWTAASIHLGISGVIASLVLVLIYMVWYPAPYFSLLGGSRLVYLLIGVDVVIGPLITLIIFKAGKKGLKFDLAVIACLQAAALTYGVTIAAGARPVYSVFVVDRFEVVSAGEIDPADLAKVTREEFKSLPWTGPRIAGALKPASSEEANRVLFSMFEGKDLQNFPQLYVPYADVAAEAGRRAQPLELLRRYNRERGAEVDGFLVRNGLREDAVGFVPLKSRRGLRSVIVRKNGDVLGVLDLSPWGD